MSDLVPHTLSFTRRKLPHWLVADATYFVTTRLKGSLPRDVTARLKLERDALLEKEPPHSPEMLELERRQFHIIDGILDRCGQGPTWLAQSCIAEQVIRSLPWLCRRGWNVRAVLMPNHMHLLMRNHSGRTARLTSDLGQLKSFSGQAANSLLHRKGAFWMPENFSHWCRTDEKSEWAWRYMLQNPVAAGLVRSTEDWPWLFQMEHVE